MEKSRLLSSLVVVAALAVSREAAAYCRTASCAQGTGARCNPAQADDCGIPVFWPTPCVGFSLQEDASSEVSLATAEEVFATAFATWTSADCGDGTPRLRVKNMGTVACTAHEYNQNEELGNANLIVFRDESWPHKGGNSTLALTTVTYNLDTGEIYDADMELNSAQATFTTGDENIQSDLRSIATHETGHFLGLSHSAQKDATMYKDYVPGSSELRTLTDDDRAAICDVYPPGESVPESCDATPRHGFATECSSPPGDDAGCCTTAPGAPTRSGEALLAAALGAVLLAARRRRGA